MFSAWSSYFSQQRFCSCSVVLSFPHRSRLRTWIVTLHCESALVTTPLMIGRVVGDVDRRGAVQVPAEGSCTPYRQLRRSVLLVILPPAQDRGMVVVFPCSFLGVYYFPMVFLPFVDLHASFLLNDSLVQDNTALSKLAIWL